MSLTLFALLTRQLYNECLPTIWNTQVPSLVSHKFPFSSLCDEYIIQQFLPKQTVEKRIF